MRTVDAYIDENGVVHLREAVKLNGSCRALVTIFDGEESNDQAKDALMSEAALGDWNRPEEDAAWSHLQADR